ncbi:hypothetical protein L226DRAFT_520054 [Lentinus tigrinus ALCF2SS1-7]|uniref:uncharacterized protein n=1 Tax=Lentinus tigrinus ALCF2SS1-7 TaxID=1328758 RepID=UPI001165E810|nr:hypothetical protein L226DRAFT_520054 [Lentinus tigrinus ALCF2SS1-7]
MSDPTQVIAYIAAVHVTGFASSTLDLAARTSTSRRRNGWFRWLYTFIGYFPLSGEVAFFAYFHAQPAGSGSIGAATCNIMSSIESILTGISVILSVEVVILIRAWILYDRKWPVLAFLVAGLLASFVAATIGMHVSDKHWSYDQHCIVTSSGTSWAMIVVWAAPMAFETALFSMTLAECG